MTLETHEDSWSNQRKFHVQKMENLPAERLYHKHLSAHAYCWTCLQAK